MQDDSLQSTLEIVGGERGVVVPRHVTVTKPKDLQHGVDEVVRQFRSDNP